MKNEEENEIQLPESNDKDRKDNDRKRSRKSQNIQNKTYFEINEYQTLKVTVEDGTKSLIKDTNEKCEPLVGAVLEIHKTVKKVNNKLPQNVFKSKQSSEVALNDKSVEDTSATDESFPF